MHGNLATMVAHDADQPWSHDSDCWSRNGDCEIFANLQNYTALRFLKGISLSFSAWPRHW
eukprot:9477625-Pyramimonas_sp.AAC.1